MKTWTKEDLRPDNQELLDWLTEASETIRAIRHDEVDAVVVVQGDTERVTTLQGAHEPYRILVEQMLEGAATLDGDGTILFSNPRLSQMLQVANDTLIGARFLDYISATDVPDVQYLLKIARERSCSGEITVRAADGSAFSAHLSLSPLPWQGEGHVGVVISDLTDRNLSAEAFARQKSSMALLEAERKAHARVSSILDSMTDCYFALNLEQRVLGANAKAAEILFKAGAAEIVGKGLAEVCPELVGSQLLTQCRRAAIELRPVRFETQLPQTDLWFEVNAYPTESGMEAYLRDITERKADEIELKRKQAQIEELNIYLRRSMIETHHRIKNNLQLIAGLVEMRLIQYDELIPAEEFRRIGNHVHALSTIHDILTDEAKGQEETGAVSLQSTLTRLSSMLSTLHGRAIVATQLDETIVTPKVATSLAVVLSELINNSVKHGEGEIGLRVTVSDSGVKVELWDSGPGFPEGFDSATSAHTGLQIVEQLVRWDLRGAASYGASPEGGAHITISMPLPDRSE